MATVLSTDQVMRIASLKKHKGRELLAEFLDLTFPVSDEDNFRQSILLDYLHDSLMFGVEKGLPWTHVCSTFQLAREMQEESVGISLPDAVKLYTSKAQRLQGEVSEKSLKMFTEHFFVTFMHHFKLFQYVFTQEQERQIAQCNLGIDVPLAPMPFSESKDETLWEYEQKVGEVEQREVERTAERETEHNQVKADTTAMIEEAMCRVQSLEEPCTNEMIAEIVADIAKAHIASLSSELSYTIDETLEDLEFKLEKTSIPRPLELGAPPRYRTKTPVSASRRKSPERGKSSKSRQSDRSAKSRC